MLNYYMNFLYFIYYQKKCIFEKLLFLKVNDLIKKRKKVELGVQFIYEF